MKKLSFVSFFLLFIVLFAFSEPETQEEIDYLLFLPDESSLFVNETQAMIQLDNLAKYLLGKSLTPGQIYVYGYAAFAENEIDPVRLSTERAIFIIGELQRRGIARNLFASPVGHGSVYLWGGNTHEDNRSPNRRVRVILDGSIVTPEIIKESASEIVISNADNKEPVRQETIKGSESEIVISSADNREPVRQETIKESASEIVISSADDKEPVRQETKTEKSGAKLPLWPFILLHLFVLIGVIFFIVSRRKKSQSAKPAESVKTEQVKAEPAKVQPLKTESVKTEPVKADPAKAESVKTESVKTELAKVKSLKAESAKVEPVKTEPVKAGSAKAEPVKTEPVKTESAKADPAKAESVKAKHLKAKPVETESGKAEPVIIAINTLKLDEEIRQRAYELHLERGSKDGNMDKDWFDALNDVCAKYESAGYRIYSEGDDWWATLQETNPA